jgi:hypothetical protein
VRFVAAVLLVLLLAVPARSSDFLSLNNLKNWFDYSCIDFKIKGICIKHTHFGVKVGIKVSYYLPVAVVETPPTPYQTELPFLKPFLEGIEPVADRIGSAVLSTTYEFGGNVEGVEDTYYREAHIVSFPGIASPVLQVMSSFCDEPDPVYFFWFSETDPLNWRLGLKDYLKAAGSVPKEASRLVSTVSNLSTSVSTSSLSPSSVISLLKSKLKSLKEQISSLSKKSWKELLESAQKGAEKLASKIPDAGWGSKTPHTGYVHDVSSTIAYHLIAVRALDYSFPLKPRWGTDKFQMVYPTHTGCYKLGDDRIKTEKGKMVGGETPVWIYWYKFECCVF